MASTAFDGNTLFYGDNLEILCKYFPDDSVNLVYLDPPFNSKADYNILFKEPSGQESVAQIQAFSDFWHWDKIAEKAYMELQEDPKITDAIQFLQAHLGRNDMMAYLVMMTIRLRELHRVLKSTGSIYLHCDPTASHYLKIVMDLIFGPKNFRNEIMWQRFTFHADAHRFGRVHDILLFYTKTDSFTYNPQFTKFKKSYIKSHFTHKDKKGVYTLSDASAAGQGPPRDFNGRLLEPPRGTHWRWSQENIDRLIKEGIIVFTRTGRPRVKRYLDKTRGHAVHSVWTDIPPINSMAKERMGFQTQKPMKLLERIISASSNKGDLVLDPFCGCGTAIVASHKLKRRWIGIDITHLAISLIKSRLRELNVYINKDYKIIGEPVDFASASELAQSNPFQFQWWALSLIDARPTNPDKKKGADKGVDGWIMFRESASINLKRIVIQVKGGKHVGPHYVRDLIGTVESSKSAMGILITLTEPTKPMKQAAMEAEYYESPTWGHKYPKIQIITVGELLSGKKPILPHTQSAS